VLLLGLVASTARAQDRFDIESFQPATHVEGSVLAVYGARTLTPRSFTLSVLASYGRKPLALENADSGETLAELIGSIGSLQLMGAVGLWKRFDLGVALPIHRVSRGSEFDPAPPPAVQVMLMESTEVALGDLQLVPRVQLFGGERGYALALLVPLWLPTGNDDYYAGEPFRIEPRVSADYRSARGDLIALNVGYLFRSRADILGTRVDDMLRVGAGADVPIVGGLSALAELDTQFNVLAGPLNKANAPTEALFGLRFRRSGWLAQAGGGPGLVRGIAAPRYRFFVSVSFSRLLPPDDDRDGIADKVDRCPSQAEDHDGFGDEDGCPDPDNDGDGVADARDRCPAEPEDTDGHRDDDGCQDPDDDGDSVLDGTDLCPTESEDHDGFLDQDGCIDPDNDDDGVADAEDRCPNLAGAREAAGCVPPPAPRVVVTEETIELPQPVFFKKNRAELEDQSGSMLDELVAVLKAHPEIEFVSVEGHTDDTGKATHNKRLSQARAESVMHTLVRGGISLKRLRAVGYGSERPLVPNDSDENRSRNRRVGLRIERRAPAPPP
jgi:outer membrane protein OmpA-like peptidoglycan-associated protein